MLKKIFILIVILSLSVFTQDDMTTIDVHDAWDQYPAADFKSKSDKELSLPDGDTVKLLHERILNYIKKERLEYVKARVAEILNNKMQDDNAHIQAGVLYAQNFFYKESLKEFNTAKKINPKNFNTYNNIANIYYLTGHFDLAMQHYKKSLEIEKNDPLTLLNLAFINYELGNFTEARDYYFRAVLIEPSLDRKEYKVIAQANNENAKKTTDSKAANKGVSRLPVRWSK
ncbi:tetratricopeptide repeat protein [Spirochaetota bacterium]